MDDPSLPFELTSEPWPARRALHADGPTPAQRKDAMWCFFQKDGFAEWLSGQILTTLCDLRTEYPGLDWDGIKDIVEEAGYRVDDVLNDWRVDEAGDEADEPEEE